MKCPRCERPVGGTLAEAVRAHVLSVYAANGYDKLRTAAALGICIKTLYNKLHVYGVMGKPDGR